MKVVKVAQRVPFGIAVPGFAKSPDMLVPAMSPTIAGNTIAKVKRKSQLTPVEVEVNNNETEFNPPSVVV